MSPTSMNMSLGALSWIPGPPWSYTPGTLIAFDHANLNAVSFSPADGSIIARSAALLQTDTKKMYVIISIPDSVHPRLMLQYSMLLELDQSSPRNASLSRMR
jgi:hypothetical protein